MKKIIVLLIIFFSTLFAHEGDNLRIASFNIQIFGQSKINDSTEMKYIVDIIRKFDIVAIQEIRSKKQDVLPKLVKMLGEDYWDFKISPRLGRTSSKEQYGFVYRKDYVEIDTCFMIIDEDDLLHREPFVCDCRSENFDYYLVNIHTDPDEVKEEINVMDDILYMLRDYEPDTIILGDLNASPDEFDELSMIEDVFWVVDSEIMTNTRETKNYDNLVFIKSNLSEFKYGGVFNYKDYYGIDDETALRISDHFPVFGVFQTGHDDD
jgi:deoxyribonuclease-1-like protein